MQSELGAVGRKLRSARAESGLTLDAISDNLGVSRQAYQAWEAGKTFPEVARLVAVAKLFRRPVGWFFEEAGPSEHPVLAIEIDLKKREGQLAIQLPLQAPAATFRWEGDGLTSGRSARTIARPSGATLWIPFRLSAA